MTSERSVPAGIALHVCTQWRKPKLVQPSLCCALGVSAEQVTKTAAGVGFKKSCFSPAESLATPSPSELWLMKERGLVSMAIRQCGLHTVPSARGFHCVS